MDIKDIISQVVREALPGVVRDIVRGELGLSKEGMSKGQARLALPVTRRTRRPSLATENGVDVGQRWEGKSYAASAGRVIEIAGLGKEKITPKVLKTNGTRGVAKPISYGMLVKSYKLVK